MHGFGIKQTALENAEIRSLLYSCDSFAWHYPKKFDSVRNHSRTLDDSVQNQLHLAKKYQEKIFNINNNSVSKKVPKTAGAGNGQGRKPKWNLGKTKAIRVPEVIVDKVIEYARTLDNNQSQDSIKDKGSL